MKPLKFPVALTAFAMLSLASVPADAAPWDMPIREIPMPGLDDIAKASYDALGPDWNCAGSVDSLTMQPS